MTRGHPPVVAIAEAMYYAERIGFLVIEVHAPWLASDFMAISEGKITRVRVRRIRYGHYGLPDIVASCTREILELRSTPIPEDTRRGALGPGSGQALAQVCRSPLQDRSIRLGYPGSPGNQAPGAADASGRVMKNRMWFNSPYFSFFPQIPRK